MSETETLLRSVRDVLTPFGTLRSQPASDWTGAVDPHPSLFRFHAAIGPWGGPWGQDGPRGPDGITIPTLGNPFQIMPLSRLWDMQAGYRWNSRSGERLADWQDEWLVVADQGGDPFILDGVTGSILHAHHGAGAWAPEPLFADIFTMALVLGTIGTVHAEAGESIYDEDFNVRPAWRTALRARLAPILGDAGSDAVASRFDW